MVIVLLLLIIKGLGYPAILGPNQLERGSAKFAFESNTLVWFGSSFPLHRCPDSHSKSEISTFTRTGRTDIDKLLNDYKEILDAPGRQLPACPLVECEIPTDSRPIRQWAYRTPLAKRQIISEQIDEMLAQNIRGPSSSPWSSPITLLPKSSGEYRFCVDYRKLNSVTVKDSFPLPLIQDIFDQLQGGRVFTCLDLKAAYNQISVSEQDIPKTAFICHRGLFEYLRMPFGLFNAPAVCQRIIECIAWVGRYCVFCLFG